MTEEAHVVGTPMSEEMEFPACILCGSSERQVLFRPRADSGDLRLRFSASQGILGAQTVVRCSHCGLFYVCPRLRGEAVTSAYSDSVDELYVSQAKPA